jgi:hypothetical protein
MTMRPFTAAAERALAKLHRLPGFSSTLDITHDRLSIYQRLSDQGLAVIEQASRRKRARLTVAGRYFAELVAAKEARNGR